MSVYKSILQGITAALDYQQDKIPTRKTKLTIKPVDTFITDEIKLRIQKIELSKIVSAGSLGISTKTLEIRETSRNKLKDVSYRLLEFVRDNPWFLRQFRAEATS